jgi:formylglycine-generating enzyme required for sulfatase activity
VKQKSGFLYTILLIIAGVYCQTFAQTVVPKYSALSANNPFSRYSSPIGLAILRFDGDAVLDIKLFNILKQDTAVLKKFTIFPYNVLQAQMSVLGLSSLDPSDRETLSQLRDQLNISLVVTGKAITSGFELRLLPTNGSGPYVRTYLNTANSTALNDAAKLFRDNVQTDYINVGSIDWVRVDSGTFQMGSNEGYGDERPVHAVSVKSFYMSATEVTFDQYDAFCEATGRAKSDDNGWGRGKMPVSNVSWDDANAYCHWLSEQLGETVRMPTEAEFEYAARGGNKSKATKFSGSDYSDDVAWFIGNSKGRPHDVGSRMPNELGLYDMSGNVWEWCLDWYHSSYDGAPTDGSAWNVESPDTPYHVVRCGSWNSSSENCRVAVRNAGSASGWVNFAGFRLVREIK